MDAKEQRPEGVLGEGINNGSSNYNQTAFPSADKNKSYLDIGSNPSSKVAVRPCAVIGPDRVAPPQHAAAAEAKRAPVEPWFIDHGYQPPPQYPYKLSDYQHPSRNISPRQTFQENMPRIMVPRYNPPKVSEDHNFTVDKTNAPSKPSKLHEAKYPEVPYAINSVTNEQKHQRCPEAVSNVNQTMLRPATHGWPPGAGLRPPNPYVPPEMYSYPEYAACAAPRPLPMMGARAPNEEAAHMYPDYYRGGNVRFEPYPVMKDQYRPPRYEYIANYPGSYQPPFTHYPPQKYDLQKLHPSVVQHPHYAGHPQATFLRDPVLESYQRQSKTQPNYNVPYHGQAVHAKYNLPPGNPMHHKLYQYPPTDSANLSAVAMKPPYDPNNKYYLKYDNPQQKSYPTSENYTLNEIPRNHSLKNQMIPNYPINMHHLSYYRKEHIPAKNSELYPPFKTTEPFYNNPQSRIPTQFSPNIISPSDSVASSDLSHAFSNQEDCGYASQSSTTSIRSTDSSMYKMYDRRYRHIMGTQAAGKTEISSGNLDPSERKKLDVRQFLQSWNEEDDENSDKSNSNEIVVKTSSNLTKHCEVVNNPEQLYVLGLVNVPSDELAKYEHIQTVSKLPENIKGYTSIELLNQFEEAIESSNMNNYSKKPSISKESPQVPANKITQAKVLGIPNRPISPLDVESKISQSVIHKDVGCNFEIRPCSPKMLNVQVAAPAQSLLGERHIEKVTNSAISKVMTNEDKAVNNCEVMKRNVPRAPMNDDDISAPSCKMLKTQFKESLDFIEPVKTSYSVQDLESNSGVCLASLPRLDSDIELSFPEVNQQFINANKPDSIEQNSAIESTPLHKQPWMAKPNEINTKIDYPRSSNEQKMTEKHSNLKPVDVKASEPTCVQVQPLRTNSVIIKNPESNDVLNCLVDTTQAAKTFNSVGDSHGKASTESIEKEEKKSDKEELKFDVDCNAINTQGRYQKEIDVNEIQDLSHKNTEHNIMKKIEDSCIKETENILRSPDDKTIINYDISTNKIIDDVTKNGNLPKSQTHCNTEHNLVNDQSKELTVPLESVTENNPTKNMLALSNTTNESSFHEVNSIELEKKYVNDNKSKNVDNEPKHYESNESIRDTFIPTKEESNVEWEGNPVILDENKNDETIENNSGKDKAQNFKDRKHHEIENKSTDAKVHESEEKVNKSINEHLKGKTSRSPNISEFHAVKDTTKYNDGSDIYSLNTNSFKMFKTHGKNKYVNVDFEIDSETFANGDNFVQPVKDDNKINELKWPALAVIPNIIDEDSLVENNATSDSSQTILNISDHEPLDHSPKNITAADSDSTFSFKESSPAESESIKEDLINSECSATTVVSETHKSDISEENTIPDEIGQDVSDNILLLMANDEQHEIVDAPRSIQAHDVNVDLNHCSEASTPISIIEPKNEVINETSHDVQEDFKNEGKMEIDLQIKGAQVSMAVLLKKELYSPVFQRLILFEGGLCSLRKQPQSSLQDSENNETLKYEIKNSINDNENNNGACEKEDITEQEHGSMSEVLEFTTKNDCQDNHDACSELTSDLNFQSGHKSCNNCNKSKESIKDGICKQCSLEKKVLQKKFSPIKSRKRRTFKRSLSDSALYSTNDGDQQVDDFASFNDKDCSSPHKRKKDCKDNNSNESNLIEMEPNNYCNFLPINRRYSISSPYEGNISFCILIDENCIIAEEQDEGGEEGICLTDVVQENLESIYDDDAVFEEKTECETAIVEPQVEVPPSEAYTFEYQQEDNLVESWVDDVACVETVVSDNIEDENNLNAVKSSPESNPLDSDDSLTNEDHTRRIKELYGDEICSNDIDLIKTLYTTPQKDLNRTLQDRDLIFDTEYKDENDHLEQILSGYDDDVFIEKGKENYDVKSMTKDSTISNEINQQEVRASPKPADEILSNSNTVVEKKQEDDNVKSYDLSNSVKSTILDQKSDPEYKRSSSSPEVTSTTYEEKKSGILMKITNYGGSITSHIDHFDAEKKLRCKLTEASGYYCSKNETISSKPMITKAAQKYIPPIRDELSDLKVKLRLPEQSLTKLKLLKLSKAGPKINPIKSKSSTICNNVRSGAIKKPKPKFEDVLKNIDEVQIKMLKEKSKKIKTTFIPKVIIKKTENGSHYTSRSSKDSFNPDLTGRKWQPWVFIERNPFIEKMVLRGKRRAIYCHRKKSYILLEKFRKYKSVCTNSSNFVITSPNFEHVSGPLKYTIRLKRDEF